MSAILGYPLTVRHGYDAILSNPANVGVSNRRSRNYRTTPVRVFTLTYGPGQYSDIDLTVLSRIRTRLGCAATDTVAIPNVGTVTGRWQKSFQWSSTSPTRFFVTVEFEEE